MLKKNDIIDIISPGTACTLAEIKEIKNFVKKIGLTPRIFLEKETTIKKPTSHKFASIAPKTRFEQLKKAIEAKDSKVIWCTRGGYGSAEILPFLQKMKKPKTQKILIGFSDISTISTFLIQQWNWKVISGPMLAQFILNDNSKKSQQALIDLIFGKTSELNYQLVGKKIALSAPIVGGCLSVLCGLFGTKNQPNWQNKILFLEDEGESGERLDRFFNQIITVINESGKKPKAVLLGNFLEATDHCTPQAANIEIAIKRFEQSLGKIPLFIEKSKSLGHSKNTMPLLLGAEAKISTKGILHQKI